MRGFGRRKNSTMSADELIGSVEMSISDDRGM
jgi:hypothetical protein